MLLPPLEGIKGESCSGKITSKIMNYVFPESAVFILNIPTVCYPYTSDIRKEYSVFYFNEIFYCQYPVNSEVMF